MHARRGTRPQLQLLLLLQLIFVLLAPSIAQVHGHHHHHNHAHLHKARARRDQGEATPKYVVSNSTSSNNTTDDPFEMVKKAQAVMRIINKELLENPNFNKNEFDPEPGQTFEEAPPLPWQEGADFTSFRLRRRQSSNNTGGAQAYSIPPELAEAARIVAESTPQIVHGDHAEKAAEFRRKYDRKVADTNMPPQALINPTGLEGYVVDESSLVSDNMTFLNVPETLSARQSSTQSWWMADITKRGASPYGPANYKVWRNVKDYGAKGDGKTDDTAAINKAISDGGRCGANCGSSTVTPAVVYFPPGTYLVSSSIIQYYNTQFLGNPFDIPTIQAASSFIGLGVITSNQYIGEQEEWYINTNNFLRSVRNFKIDIRNTDPTAQICGIHWQVAQASTLENIDFYMLYNKDYPQNTQQGIYMENGSGGFLADLLFVGGKYGAYFGNQQFTTHQLFFWLVETAVQVHWDWAWTMQDVIIESCQQGLKIIGGAANGPGSTGQGVGSFILVDAQINNTPKGIITTLYKENSTSLLVQNLVFNNVEVAISEESQGRVLLAGLKSGSVKKENWGFGKITNGTAASTFYNGGDIPVMNRTTELVSDSVSYFRPNFFTRRRPKYDDIGLAQIIDVKTYGVKGDGLSDDTAAINNVLATAANMSSIVFFPFGVYVISDTVRVPVGSRIIGQAWSQIMAAGAKFEDVSKPRVAVQVGQSGDVGIAEIQDMMITTSGPTAGAVLLEWNVYQSSKGAAGMWDTHIRVGGAIGSRLQKGDCPKLTGSINKNCIAASMLMNFTPKSSAYLENIWAWVADHDLDTKSQDQIDIYSGRGILVQSQVAWLYGTSSEHNVLYQYQLSGAKNILMGMIQTESPYFQPMPRAPAPFPLGLFPDDPDFKGCSSLSPLLCSSWALRMIDTNTVYSLGSGLYSFFSNYTQNCLKTENCQQRGVHIEESYDVWIYNLCTKAIVEMISPYKGVATLANQNQNGFLSSILAWLQGSKTTAGKREFPGYTLYTADDLSDNAFFDVSSTCKTALQQSIKCDDYTQSFVSLSWRGAISNKTLADSVCDSSCSASLKTWFDSVTASCAGYNLTGAPPTLLGGRIWAGVNETCHKLATLNPGSSSPYCGDVIKNFTKVAKYQDMPQAEACHACYLTRFSMMQSSAYSTYDQRYQAQHQYLLTRCSKTANTTVPNPLVPRPPPLENPCLTNTNYTAAAGDTCDSIALAKNVSSAAIWFGNSAQFENCSSIATGVKLCLPLSCDSIYKYGDNETCDSIEKLPRFNYTGAEGEMIRSLNSWINVDCSNLQTARLDFGSVLCVAPQGGSFNSSLVAPINDTSIPKDRTGYAEIRIPPPANATVAKNTTLSCGRWDVVNTTTTDTIMGDTCEGICLENKIPYELFIQVNPSLPTKNCTASLVNKAAYCVGPLWGWNNP